MSSAPWRNGLRCSLSILRPSPRTSTMEQIIPRALAAGSAEENIAVNLNNCVDNDVRKQTKKGEKGKKGEKKGGGEEKKGKRER